MSSSAETVLGKIQLILRKKVPFHIVGKCQKNQTKKYCVCALKWMSY